MGLPCGGRHLAPDDVKVGDRVIFQVEGGRYVDAEVEEVGEHFIKVGYMWWVPYRAIREVLRKEERDVDSQKRLG